MTQDPYLLHASVAENLRFARPDASDEDLYAAARTAQVHDLIAALPDGYDTVVGERGHRFSGGEKQRLSLARTLLRDPRVLLLDEATSALDTATELAMTRALDRPGRSRTTITIAHRLSTVRRADQIVVLDRGRWSSTGRTTTCWTAAAPMPVSSARRLDDPLTPAPSCRHRSLEVEPSCASWS